MVRAGYWLQQRSSSSRAACSSAPVSRCRCADTQADVRDGSNQSDARLDRALVSLLTTNLSRDGALEVVSTQRMFGIQKQLRNADAAAIDRTTARDIASRAGAGTMVTGTSSSSAIGCASRPSWSE
jgi:hypothetical protein